MIRFSKLTAALAVVPMLAVTGSALADSPGQLTDNANNFVVKNLTQNGAYANNVSAACNEEVQYSVRLHNAAFGGLTNVQVSANILSGKMTAVPAEGASQGTTGNATVTLPSNGSIAYEGGSTVLRDVNGNVIKALPDGITASGVNVGNIAGSTTEFVNFKAKVACPPTETPKVSLACVDLSVSKIDRTHYDFTVTGSAQNATITGYTFTAKDSNSKVVDTKTVSTSATSAVYHFNQEAGTYTVSAQLNTDHGNATSDKCVKQITVESVPTTPSTPATTLPNTGAGDVVGIFAGASAAGTAAHAIVTRRRKN
jgi:LPXTG-motif cell wall-anchored protein